MYSVRTNRVPRSSPGNRQVTMSHPSYRELARSVRVLVETQRDLLDSEETDPSAVCEKGSTEQMYQTMQMLRTLLELHPQAAALADAKGSWVVANRAFGSVFGVSTALRSLPATWKTRFSGPLRMDEAEVWSRLSSERPRLDLRFDMRKQDGTDSCFLAHGVLLERKLDGNYLIAWTFFEVGAQSPASVPSHSPGDSHASPSGLSSPGAGTAKEASAMRPEPLHRDCLTCAEKSREALKLLMRHTSDQKHDLEQRIAENYFLTVLPLIDHLKSMNLSASQAYLLETLEFNLKHINSVFHINVASRTKRLSAREVEICQLIRAGKASRQIADALGLKLQTVMVHRRHIRRKLGLRNKALRLSVFLQRSLDSLY